VICPNCGAEYQPGFTRCSDCRVDLVDPEAQPRELAETPAEPAREPTLERPVCVYRGTLRGRMPLAESLLQSAGIPFSVSGEYMQQLTGLDAYGTAELYVAATDADDARAVLAELDQQA
jgi:hypothetical protein